MFVHPLAWLVYRLDVIGGATLVRPPTLALTSMRVAGQPNQARLLAAVQACESDMNTQAGQSCS